MGIISASGACEAYTAGKISSPPIFLAAEAWPLPLLSLPPTLPASAVHAGSLLQ
jgi:hypothetical protein